MLNIIPFREEHLEDAARLVRDRYQRLRDQVPYLPDRYTEVETLYPLLQNLFTAVGFGVAAIRGNRLVGFLSGWQMPAFRGKRSVYSPEWANAADMEDSARIYEEMYSNIGTAWVADQYIAHYISLFPNDVNALRAWNWMGFGMFAIDAIRGLDPIQGDIADVRIQRAGLSDIKEVMELHESLWQYIKGSPIFVLSEKRDQAYLDEWLGNQNKVVWLGYSNDEPEAFIRLGPADDEVCTIIYDEKTTSIYAAYTKEKARRGGIATALLDHALKAARKSGYERCAVPFEPMNRLGTCFWLKHFQPVCYSILRMVDDRLTKIHNDR